MKISDAEPLQTMLFCASIAFGALVDSFKFKLKIK